MYIISLTRFHPQFYSFFLVFLFINLYKTLHTSCNFLSLFSAVGFVVFASCVAYDFAEVNVLA